MTPADRHLDSLESRSPESREAASMAALAAQVAHARSATPWFAATLEAFDPAAITSRAALARLPVVRKHELLEHQHQHQHQHQHHNQQQNQNQNQHQRHALDAGAGAPSTGRDPFGGFAAIGWGAGQPADRRARRVFASPGPIYEPEGAEADAWRMARALHAAGLRAGDLVHNAFSYHFTPAGAMMESGAVALGCTVFPAGTGQTEQQVQAIAALRPAAYVGTPSFLKLILDKADALGLTLPSLRKASVGGEAFPAALRDAFAARGIAAYQSYGTADLGLVAYETEAREGLVVDEGVIVEIVRPGTGDPLPEGEVGEVVVTPLANRGYPLIRFGTGDLSAVLPGPCPTGRTNLRIRGWMGRADQTAKVRGMFVHPSQVAEVLRRHAGLGRGRLVIDGPAAQDRMTLHVEVPEPADGLAEQLRTTLRDLTKLRGEVVLHPPGALPNDGKVIADERPIG